MRKKKTEGSFFDTVIYTEGKCTYKLCREKDGTVAAEIIKHKDEPLTAPEIFIYSESFSYEFGKVCILNDDDLDNLIKNILELKKFIQKVKKIRIEEGIA